MRRLAFTLALLAAGHSLAEAARPDTRTMSCGQAAGLVAQSGAIVLTTGQHTYERFVASGGFCPFDQWADRAWAPTAEGRCVIGYVCRHRPAPWEDGLFDR